MTNVIQSTPYLIKQRSFPNDDMQELGVELDRTYIDIANRVNERTIGIYAQDTAIQTGDQYFLNGQSPQALRRFFQFQTTNPIPHNITPSTLAFVLPKCYGSYTDGTNWYGLIYATSVAIAGQITFYLNANNIVFVLGAGAPALTKGCLNIEYIGTS